MPAGRFLERPAPQRPYQGHEEAGDPMSVVSSMDRKNWEGPEADLDPPRGVGPPIVVGAALWGIVFAIPVLIWGWARRKGPNRETIAVIDTALTNAPYVR